MRSLPFSATQNKALPFLITIQRGIGTLRFTTHHTTVTVGSDVYNPGEGADVTNIQFPSDCSPSTCDVQIFASSGQVVAPGDALRGALDGWPISIQMFDLGNPGVGAYDLMPAATITQCTEDGSGIVTLSVSGQLNKAKGPVTEHFTLTGREDLGDDRCKIPILPAEIKRSTTYVRADIVTGLLAVNDCYGRVATGVAGTVEDYANVYYECTTAGTTASSAPSYDPVVGHTTTDGTAVFTARNAWLRYARGQRTGAFTIQLTALPDSRASDDAWYVLGKIYVRSGPLNGFPPIPVRSWNHATLTLTTAFPIGLNDLPANSQLELVPGCDLTREMCFSRFNNIVNLRAETFVPPSNALGLF